MSEPETSGGGGAAAPDSIFEEEEAVAFEATFDVTRLGGSRLAP